MKIRRLSVKKVAVIVFAIIALGVASCAVWYKMQLRPVDASDTAEVDFSIESGMTPSLIGDKLQEEDLIRSKLAFLIYASINRVSGNLKAGKHYLARSQSVGEIVENLQKSETRQRSITFVPGAMLVDNSNSENKQDIKTSLITAGYDEQEVEQALGADYPEFEGLFKGRPEGAGLEGYVYGETYFADEDASAEQVIRLALAELDRQIKQNDLESKFEKQGISLYEGIVLASIVQKEVSCHGKSMCEDQQKVAQVFHKRLREDISLGADATFVYAAKQDGESPTVDYDSPYNTRLHKGLTPGPISSPGLGALLAVADPADGDYLFFVSGDDGVNYFSKTEEEHTKLTQEHCIENCKLPE